MKYLAIALIAFASPAYAIGEQAVAVAAFAAVAAALTVADVTDDDDDGD